MTSSLGAHDTAARYANEGFASRAGTRPRKSAWAATACPTNTTAPERTSDPMNANATLTELRRIADVVLGDKEPYTAADAYQMAESFRALDLWLVGQGELPAEWKRSAKPARKTARGR